MIEIAVGILLAVLSPFIALAAYMVTCLFIGWVIITLFD